MPLYRLLQDRGFEPDQLKAMAYAFEAVCQELGLPLIDKTGRESIARKVIEFAERGERDPLRLKDEVLAAARSSCTS